MRIHCTPILACCLGLSSILVLGEASAASPSVRTAAAPLHFRAAGTGEFTFDTGMLRGRLRPDGKCLGLASVVHIPSAKRLDRSNGLLSHYRVFTRGLRYGGGAWDWPSEARLREDGAVEVRWAAAEQRPFQMQALYRWRTATTLDVETTVIAQQTLTGFESFLACYFNEGFTNAAIYVSQSPEANDTPGFLPARKDYGDWLMFPRDSSALALITDGRWKLQPNPVDWTAMPRLAKPIVFRRDPATGLTAVLMSPPEDCFAIASPHQAEGHYSVYLSLFGRDIKAGESARARTRLILAQMPSDGEILKLYQSYLDDLQPRRH